MKTWLIQRWCDYWAPRKRLATLQVERNQKKVFSYLLRQGGRTAFGRAHHFDKIRTYADFCSQVPLRQYNDLVPYIERIARGEKNVLWPGLPVYFVESSGTTTGVHKTTPLSREMLMYQLTSSREVVEYYIYRKRAASVMRHKMLGLTGDTAFRRQGVIPSGRVSNIGMRNAPKVFHNRLLTDDTIYNTKDFKVRMDMIADRAIQQGIGIMAAIPFWAQYFFRALLKKTDKKYIKDVLPHLQLFIHGGTTFEPYRKEFFSFIGKEIDTVEVYSASEGYMAHQDTHDVQSDGMLLTTDRGIFYEFIPMDTYHSSHPKRCLLQDVQIGPSYAVVVNTASGLWGHLIGDVVSFVSLNPYRIKVMGRSEQTISMLGEHIIAAEVENAMTAALKAHPEMRIEEFSVTPAVGQKKERHLEWWVEFLLPPKDKKALEESLHNGLKKENSFYAGTANNGLLKPPRVYAVKAGTFATYMEEKGKFEGQSKTPRLSEDAALVKFMKQHCLEQSIA